MLPSWIVLDDGLRQWLQEDIGRGDLTTLGLGHLSQAEGEGRWVAKASGIAAGLPVAKRVFELVDPEVRVTIQVDEGQQVEPGSLLLSMQGKLASLLTAERVALNLCMRMSGISTATSKFVEAIKDLPSQFVDTRKTTPGLRILEKYSTYIGGAKNHRMGLDDGVMLKENHIAAAGGIGPAVTAVRKRIPYPISVEIETETLEQVETAIAHKADIIMLDNMPIDQMKEAVGMIRKSVQPIKIEASGNITLETIRSVAEAGVDYISSSAPITRSHWLDISMRIENTH